MTSLRPALLWSRGRWNWNFGIREASSLVVEELAFSSSALGAAGGRR